MDLETVKERMHSGKIYQCSDPRLIETQIKNQENLYEYNHTPASRMDRRQELLKEMFADLGENSFVEPPFHANWGGEHVHFGSGIYANVGLSLVDDGHIYVGDHVMIGPHVVISAATHPISPKLRRQSMQYNLPVHIEDNVWLGAGVLVMPGVTVGENSVIGAGSVVTKDIPANVVAVGNPCRVVREITEEDEIYYDHGKLIDL